MKRLAVLLLLLGAGCPRATQRPPANLPPNEIDETAPAQPPRLLDGFNPVGEAVRFSPIGSPTLQAVLLERDVVDVREVVLLVARLDGEQVTSTPIAQIRVGGGTRRDVLVKLGRWQNRALRVDVSVFELLPPRRFAVKMMLVEFTSGKPLIVLDRLVESGDDARDKRATLAARDVDGDGAPELVIDERESGARRRTLVYRRNRDGVYVTRDPSLFTE